MTVTVPRQISNLTPLSITTSEAPVHGPATDVTTATRRLVQGARPVTNSDVGSAPSAPVGPLRASRWQERQPLPGVHARMTGEGVTPHPRRAPVRRGPSRPAPGGALLDITAYCATGHPTASGKQPAVGMAAGNRWPFGTRLHIAGYGDVVIEDRIGWGSDVDLYFGAGPSCEQRASDFGRRHLLVSVVA